MASEIYLFIALVGFVCLLVSTFQWKTSFYFFFIWVLIEGAMRKWFFPGIEKPLFFVKYFILTGPFIKCMFKPPKEAPFFPLMILYSLWCLFQFANWTATNDIRVFIIGFIIHCWFMSLVFITPQIFTSNEKILRFFKIMMIITVPVLLLGITQFYLPSNHYLNKYVQDVENIAVIHGASQTVRITGTFAYLSYAVYLRFYIIALIALLLIKHKKIIVLLIYFCLLLGGINLLMSGSRAPMLGVLVSIMFIIPLSYSKSNPNWGKLVSQLLIALLALALFFSFSESGQYFFERGTHRFSNTEEMQKRIVDMVIPMYIADGTVIGYGIGTTYQGVSQFVNLHKLGLAFENFNHRVLIEIGFVGFLIYTLLQIIALMWMFKLYRSVRNHENKIWIIFAMANCSFLFFWGFVFSYVDSIIYWFCLGLAVSVARIEKNTVLSQARLYNTQRIVYKKQML